MVDLYPTENCRRGGLIIGDIFQVATGMHRTPQWGHCTSQLSAKHWGNNCGKNGAKYLGELAVQLKISVQRACPKTWYPEPPVPHQRSHMSRQRQYRDMQDMDCDTSTVVKETSYPTKANTEIETLYFIDSADVFWFRSTMRMRIPVSDRTTLGSKIILIYKLFCRGNEPVRLLGIFQVDDGSWINVVHSSTWNKVTFGIISG